MASARRASVARLGRPPGQAIVDRDRDSSQAAAARPAAQPFKLNPETDSESESVQVDRHGRTPLETRDGGRANRGSVISTLSNIISTPFKLIKRLKYSLNLLKCRLKMLKNVEIWVEMC